MDAGTRLSVRHLASEGEAWHTWIVAKVVGRRMRAGIERSGRSYNDILSRYAELRMEVADLTSPERLKALRDWDETKLSRLFNDNPSAPKQMSLPELFLFAMILETTVANLLGSSGVQTLDPTSGAEHTLGFQDILKDETAKIERELLGWGECLPCSFETERFMKLHHAEIFSAEAICAPKAVAARVREVYDNIGAESIRRFKAGCGRRTWTFKDLIFEDDLARITACTREYVRVDTQTMRGCLQNLAEIIDDPSSKTELWVIPGSRHDLPNSRRALKGMDNLVVFDERFAFWRSHSGVIMYADEPEWTRPKREILLELKASARRYTGSALLA